MEHLIIFVAFENSLGEVKELVNMDRTSENQLGKEKLSLVSTTVDVVVNSPSPARQGSRRSWQHTAD